MLNIYLLRHGETTYNADGNRYCGRTDAALTPKGLQQALMVKAQLRDTTFDAVYSSPLQRAYITAQTASGKEVTTDERLIEVDFGLWEGKTRDEFVAESPSLWEQWNKDPSVTQAGGTGETAQMVVERVGNFFEDIQSKYSEGNIMVVAHNGVNRLFLAHKLGMPLRNYRQLVQENSSLTLISFDSEGLMSLHKLNSKG
ncbi:histidine phosphatase family protein [Dyadobacter tibetensis]|uniref:histidine phosphatase family protein n=1 Tax=Dyadobacter tibetensis TaxID=1211851 RepID=UPI0004707071|nr:histidine phosphatase family protein [Dyadobacter tibetensis]